MGPVRGDGECLRADSIAGRMPSGWSGLQALRLLRDRDLDAAAAIAPPSMSMGTHWPASRPCRITGPNPGRTTPTRRDAQSECIEAPMNGFQIGGNGTVDGNYALTSLIHPFDENCTPDVDLDGCLRCSAEQLPNMSDQI